MMKGMIVCLTVLMTGFITSTSPSPLKGTSPVNANPEKRTTNTEELHPGNTKETPGESRKKVVFLCRSSCGDSASWERKGNFSGCQIFLRKLSGNDKTYKRAFKYCSSCSCNPKIKERSSESNKTQTDLEAASSLRSPILMSNRRSSNRQTRNSQYTLPKSDSETLRYSQKYNPRSKSSESGFVPVPGPYGFKPSTTKYPRQSQYRSDSYEDITADYHETGLDDEDILGSGHFEILSGGVFPYNDNNLGYGHRDDYGSSYNYEPKISKDSDSLFSTRFPFSFPDILSTERRSEITQATNSRGVLSHLFAVTSDLDTAD